jgi:hypothetical protein
MILATRRSLQAVDLGAKDKRKGAIPCLVLRRMRREDKAGSLSIVRTTILCGGIWASH